jgi:hypothetical protein
LSPDAAGTFEMTVKVEGNELRIGISKTEA